MTTPSLNPEATSINLPKWLLIIILGLLSMLMPLSIDMYLPSMPTIAHTYQVDDALVQLTISFYLLGFAVGQLIYGPLSDCYGRKKILLIGLVMFIIAAAMCGLSPSINELITMRFFHGLAAASTSVVISAFLRDICTDRDEFSRLTSFVILISNVAPLLAPILGGFILMWFEWQTIFFVISGIACIGLLLVIFVVPESLPQTRRIPLSLYQILINFITICRHKQVRSLMLLGGFSMAGLFSFLSLGPFVYINVYGVDESHFGYYFAFNIIVMIAMNLINSRFVRKKGALSMLTLGIYVQAIMSIYLLIAVIFDIGLIGIVVGVAGYIGCMAIIGGNLMAIILSYYPHIAGTAASLVGTVRFVIAGVLGIILALIANMHTEQSSNVIDLTPSHQSEYFMAGSMIICNILAILFFLLSKDKNKVQ